MTRRKESGAETEYKVYRSPYPAIVIIGSKIVYTESVPSTNTLASELIRNKRPAEGTIIRAGYQSEGRGQPGNRWESEAGSNLLFSIILYPEMLRPDQQFLISMALSLGIRDFIRAEAGSCCIKWPNDIYVGEGKIAGILIENSIMADSVSACVAGIGINVNQSRFDGIEPFPVSLRMLTDTICDLSDCLLKVAEKLDRRYKQLLAGEYDAVAAEYNAALYRYMEWSTYRDEGGAFTGRIISVAPEGSLVIERRDGKKSHYAFREVRFVQPGDPSL